MNKLCESGGYCLDQEGRVALVTGGSRGIGRAIAIRLARARTHVAINYLRQRASAEEVAAQIRKRDKNVPLILITRHSSEARVIATLRAGVSDYFKVLFSHEELVSIVN